MLMQAHNSIVTNDPPGADKGINRLMAIVNVLSSIMCLSECHYAAH